MTAERFAQIDQAIRDEVPGLHIPEAAREMLMELTAEIRYLALTSPEEQLVAAVRSAGNATESVVLALEALLEELRAWRAESRLRSR